MLIMHQKVTIEMSIVLRDRAVKLCAYLGFTGRESTRLYWILLGVTIYERKLKRLPLFDYRPDRRLITEGFYPIPVAFNWLSPQNEINETREMLRTHRRRFVRKFMILAGSVDDEEIEKFETGPDGALIKVNRENAITPIQNADLRCSFVNETLETSARRNLNRISGGNLTMLEEFLTVLPQHKPCENCCNSG